MILKKVSIVFIFLNSNNLKCTNPNSIIQNKSEGGLKKISRRRFQLNLRVVKVKFRVNFMWHLRVLYTRGSLGAHGQSLSAEKELSTMNPETLFLANWHHRPLCITRSGRENHKQDACSWNNCKVLICPLVIVQQQLLQKQWYKPIQKSLHY